jgi:hypothetical protein
MTADVLVALRAQHERILHLAAAVADEVASPVDDLRAIVCQHVAAAASEIVPLVDTVPGVSAVAMWARDLTRMGAVAAAGGDEAVRDVARRLVQLEEAFLVPTLGRLLSPAERRRLGALYQARMQAEVDEPRAG